MRSRLAILLALCATTAPEALHVPSSPPPEASSAAAPELWATIAQAPIAAAPADTAPLAPYIAHQVLVAPPAGMALKDLAAAVSGHVIADVGRSGFGVIEVPDVEAASRTLDQLGASSSPQARVVGAGGKGKANGKQSSSTTETTTAGAESSQSSATSGLPDAWQLDVSNIDRTGTFPDLVVAVLDTGVAYEDHGVFRTAPGLSGNPIVAPADFIELDGHANDDHQHGTHIASLIASQGMYRGAAPGAGLMPIKVLDHRNQGTEWALIEGIHHAIDNDADVINMSLSFPLGYVPSPALTAALERAHLADIVMVGAAGNDGAMELTWPAASRLVVAVGAARAGTLLSWGSHTAYTNRSPALDILAPGGSLDRDDNEDGFPDGMIGETIVPGDPGSIGLYMYEGTSQAAAVVSGAVVQLLERGIRPQDVAATLQQSHGGYDTWKALDDGSGASHLDLRAALGSPSSSLDVHVGLLPYVTRRGSKLHPTAQVSVADGAGDALPGVEVLATVHSLDGVHWASCVADDNGVCNLYGAMVADGDAWAFRVEKVVQDGVGSNPGRLLFATEPSEVLLRSVEDAVQGPASDEQLSLAIHWEEGYDELIGEDLIESWAVVNAGTGLLSSPLGVVFRPRHVSSMSTAGTLELDPDGTGLLSSPLGYRLSARTLQIDGTGLLSSPLGFQRLTLVGLQGSGLLSSPLGFHATMLYSFDAGAFPIGGSGLLSSPLGMWGQPIHMDFGSSTAALLGTSHGSAIESGGLLTGGSGYEASAWLVGTGAVEVGVAVEDPNAAPASCLPAVRIDP